MKRVQCDVCSKDFTIKLKERKHGKGIKETYFKCPNCKKEYFVSILDSELRFLQREVKGLEHSKLEPANELIKGKISDEEYKRNIDDIQNQINIVKSEMKNKMNHLKQQL
ncbi:hypothetical protein MST22_15545 [Virgibacillus halodenitrificans]|uniref:hypothetical protein n=1 Tax=Virgibacillus halodenitrificans TaxID=1482 RepID=UPI001FB506AF|nr:hypothetical protein [Virgibacillus halodenitrificans]MCJ0932561.1 hypothetical protein [Virgibacillus halodenitrificans]